MKLLLHIGTHKTATTSLQHYFTINKKHLQNKGIHYPSKGNTYHCNFLASQLAYSKKNEVIKFLEKAEAEATSLNCDTILISAESFYAMTLFFMVLHNRELEMDTYWSNEDRLIKILQEITARFQTKIICYFRPQDAFSFSIYNQLVKNTLGVSDDYETTMRKTEYMFDYEKHIQLWAKQFDKKNIALKSYQHVKQNIIKDFCDSFLSSDCYLQSSKKEFFANTRLSRDVLEAKRVFNASKPDSSLAFIGMRCFLKLSQQLKDRGNEQIFSSLSQRRAQFDKFIDGNKKLQAEYNFPLLESVSVQKEPDYNGISDEHLKTILKHHKKLMNTPLNIINLKLRRGAVMLLRELPLSRILLNPIRVLRRYITVKFFGY